MAIENMAAEHVNAPAQPAAPAEEIIDVTPGADQAKPEDAPEKPKELTPEEELDKLRKAKARDGRRIGKLTAQKYQALKEAEELRTKFAAAAPQQGGELSVAKTGIPTKLNPASFANYSEFIEARSEEIADYKIDKKLADYDTKQKQSQQSQQESVWESQRATAVDKLGDDFVKEVPDAIAVFNEHAATIGNYSPELKRAILTIQNPPMALYNLAKDGMLEDLADMSLEDARVELRLAEKREAVKPKSKAPIPLTTSRGSVPSGKDPSQMTDAEFNTWRRASLAKKR